MFNLKWIFILLFMLISVIGHRPVLLARERVKEVRIGDGKGDWGYPNPYRHYPRGPGYVRMSWVFDTLVWKDKDGYIPALAKSWRYDPDSLSFIFELQEGVKWHDGKQFSAEDVAFTVKYFKKHPYAWVPLESVAGAEANGPSRVTIKLKKPDASFLAYVGGTMPVIPKHIWEKVDDPKRYSDPAAFIGTGPFKFIDFNKAKGTYLYKANGEYYLGQPKVDRLIYIKTGKPLITLVGGKADLVNIRPDMAKLLQKKGMVVIKNQRGWNKKLMINHQKPIRHLTQDVGISQLTDYPGGFSNQGLFALLHFKRDDRTLLCLVILPNWLRYTKGFLLKKAAFLLRFWTNIGVKALAKGFSNSGNDRLENITAIVESYLLFGWVYVDIHF